MTLAHDSEDFDNDLRSDPDFNTYAAGLDGEADAEKQIPFADGIAKMRGTSQEEVNAYITAYHAAALRRIVIDSGSDLPFYDI